MLPLAKTRQILLTAKLFILGCILAAGLFLAPSAGIYALLFWAGFWLLSAAVLSGRWIQSFVARWTFQRRIRAAIPANGADQRFLAALGEAIRNSHEERAFFLLENGGLRDPTPEAAKVLRWLKALAGVRWLARQRPGRQISGFYQNRPQIYALMYAYPGSHVPLRTPALAREIEVVASEELDELALGYIALVDELVSSLSRSTAPFADEALDLLEFMTGQAHLLHPAARYAAWWKRMRPVFTRGGGAFLAALRLMQHQMVDEAARLLARIAEGGMLSAQADTLRRACVFLSMFNRPQWRMANSDIAPYFNAGFYYMAVELGVLRYPTAELPEVAACCRRRKLLMESKARMIGDVLELWSVLGDGLAPQLALVLRRLLSQRGIVLPGKLEQWREIWNAQKTDFERGIKLLMDGIVAAARNDFTRADALFNEAAYVQPGSVPLVNLIYLRLRQKRQKEALALVDTLQAHYPGDGSALISAGRLLAMYCEDIRNSETLFRRALAIKSTDPEDSPVEALLCLGEVKLLQGQYLDAQQYFENARDAEPALPDARMGLARVFLETRRYEHAIEQLKEVVAQPQGGEAVFLAHYLLYRAYREIGNDQRAFGHLDHVPPPFFKEPDILEDIASHLESGKQYKKARKFAERAMLLRATGLGRNDDADLLSAR